MHKDKYTVRIMGRREVNIAVDRATREGWNPGLNDTECFYAADQEGFLIGLVNDVPIASISAVKYGRSFGFLGFYIVSPDHRGKGYGYAIWQEGIKSLGERNIGLDGVLSQQENYKKSGFRLAYRNIRFKGISRKKTKTFTCSYGMATSSVSSFPFKTHCRSINILTKCFRPSISAAL